MASFIVANSNTVTPLYYVNSAVKTGYGKTGNDVFLHVSQTANSLFRHL